MLPVRSRIWAHLSRNSNTPAGRERGCDNNWRCHPQHQLPRCPPSRIRHCSNHTPMGRLCWGVFAITEGHKAQRACSFLAVTSAQGSCGKATLASPPKPRAAGSTLFWRAAISPPLRTAISQSCSGWETCIIHLSACWPSRSHRRFLLRGRVRLPAPLLWQPKSSIPALVSFPPPARAEAAFGGAALSPPTLKSPPV